jgi:hypothetical protein
MQLNLKNAVWFTVASFCLCSVVHAADIPGGQVFYGDTTIEAGDTVKGSITVVDGTLTVYGTVEKNIAQIGSGSIYVTGYFGAGLVNGNIREEGEGYVYVSESVVGGNISEFDEGVAYVEASLVEGNVSGEGNDVGGVVISASLVLGNASETGNGSMYVRDDSTVDGNLNEEGPGDVSIGFGFGEGGNLITGNIHESGPGGVFLDTKAIVLGNIESD